MERGTDSVPRYAGWFVAILVAAMCLCAVFAFEPYPLTSFRLFSTLRVDEQSAWSATVVERGGDEAPYPLGGEGQGFRGFAFTMAEFAEAAPERRDELCRTWVGAAPELIGAEAKEVRIYLREWRVSDRLGDEARPGTTTLRYRCGADGLIEAR